MASGQAIPCTQWLGACGQAIPRCGSGARPSSRAAKQSYLYSGQAIPSGQGVVPVQLSGLHAWLPHATSSYAAVRGRSGCIEQCTSVYVHAAC